MEQDKGRQGKTNDDDELAPGGPPRGGGDCNDQHSASGAAIGPAGDSCTNSAPSDRCYNEGGLPQGEATLLTPCGSKSASPSSPGYTARAMSSTGSVLARREPGGHDPGSDQCALVGVLEETRDIGGSPSWSRGRQCDDYDETSDEDIDTLSPGSSPHPRRGLQRSLKQGRDPRSGVSGRGRGPATTKEARSSRAGSRRSASRSSPAHTVEATELKRERAVREFVRAGVAWVGAGSPIPLPLRTISQKCGGPRRFLARACRVFRHS